MEEEELFALIDWFKIRGWKVESPKFKWSDITTTLLLRHRKTERLLRVRRQKGKELRKEIHVRDLMVDVSFGRKSISKNTGIFPTSLSVKEFQNLFDQYFIDYPTATVMDLLEHCDQTFNVPVGMEV